MKWISVRDSLPGYNKVVLWVHNGCVHAGNLGVSDTGLKFYESSECFEPFHVSDVEWWMPYPEPPKSEENIESVDSGKERQPCGENNKQSESLLCPECGSIFIWLSANGNARKCDECKHKWKK